MIRIWSSSGQLKESIHYDKPSQQIDLILELRNGNLATTGYKERGIIVWDIETENVDKTLIGHTETVKALVELENGLLASGSDDKTVRIWKVETGQLLHTYSYNNPICALAVLPNGFLISVGNDGEIEVRSQDQVSRGSNETKQTIKSGHTGEIINFVVFSNGDFASGSKNEIKIWKR